MAHIRNVTRGTELAADAGLATTFWTRMVGLLGRRALRSGEGLIIEPCKSVHTAFMRFPIDVVFVDRFWRVTKVVPDLKPFRLSGSFRRSHAVIELRSGMIEATDTRPGDQLQLEAGGPN
jgi:hypothetical protein